MATPVKEIESPCFICTTNKRHFSIHGKHATEDKILTKLSAISGRNVVELWGSRRYGLCRSCYLQVNKTHILRTRVIDAVEHGCSPTHRFKRGAASPITPKIKGQLRKGHPSKKTKKVLFCVDETSKSDISTSESKSEVHSYDINIEHFYSKPKRDKMSKDKPSHFNIVNILKEHIPTVVDPDSGPTSSVINDIVEVIISNKVLLKAVEQKMLSIIQDMCTTLASRNIAFASVLTRYRNESSLRVYTDKLLSVIINEISQRIPFVLDVFTTIVTSHGEPTEQKIAPIAAAYAILMSARSEKLSAWHRLTTIVATRGNIDDSALTTLNHLGVCMSAKTKLRLLDEAGDDMDVGIVSELKNNPLVKITGDNLDIFIRTGHKSLQKNNQDLHLFASNMIFSRIAHPQQFSLSPNSVALDKLNPELFLPHGHYLDTVMNSYIVLLGRVLSELKAFSWMKSVLPAHIWHPYHQQMAVKSKVFQLPIMFKNEAKHEDCVDILDNYESCLENFFVKAFGSNRLLEKFRVVVGGDQLTHVRFEEAKQLRSLATTRQKRFEDLDPLVIELWHIKQDFLEKEYKELYNSKSIHQPGTLYHFKAKLQRTDINGKVKGAFKQHHDFLTLVGKQMLLEQFLEYFGMDDLYAVPTENIPTLHIEKKPLNDRMSEMNNILRQFILKNGYLEMLERNNRCQCSDRINSYSKNVCRWYLQLVQMEDIVREGDVIRLVPSLMVCIPFFFSHSRLSKYFVEIIDFIMKSEHLLSPLQRIMALEGAFTNLRGGIGNNIESDLVQENSVRNQNNLIRGLGANKTEKAISRCTKAADTMADICDKIDSVVSGRKKSTRHHIPKAVKDESEILKTLRSLRPFRVVDNRKCEGFANVHSSPFHKIDKDDLRYRMTQVIRRLYWGQSAGSVENPQVDSDAED